MRKTYRSTVLHTISGPRRKGRVIAIQALYGWEITRSFQKDIPIEFSWLDEQERGDLKPEVLPFAILLTRGAIEHIQDIDAIITQQLEHWDFTRISRVDLALLRVSVYALRYVSDIPARVTINEAVEIAKLFGSGDSYRFINGILDGIRKQTHENSI